MILNKKSQSEQWTLSYKWRCKMKGLIKDKYNLRYFIPLSCFLILSLGFLSSGFIHSRIKPVVTTQIGRELSVSQASDKIVFERAELYKKSNLMVTSFYIKSGNVIPSGELEINVFNGRNSEKLEGQLEKINDNYYVLFTPNIASNFKQIINQLSLKMTNNRSVDVGSIAVTQKNISVKDEAYKTQNTHYYESQYKEYALKNLAQELQEFDKEIVEFKKNIQKYNTDNQQLLEAMKFKTGDQQKEIQQKISSNNNSIEGVKMQIDLVEKSKAQLKEQVALLEGK